MAARSSRVENARRRTHARTPLLHRGAIGGVLPAGPPTFDRHVTVDADASGLIWQRDPRGCRADTPRSGYGRTFLTAHGCTVYESVNHTSTFTVEVDLALNHTSTFTAGANLAPTVFSALNIHFRGRPDAEHRYIKDAHPLSQILPFLFHPLSSFSLQVLFSSPFST